MHPQREEEEKEEEEEDDDDVDDNNDDEGRRNLLKGGLKSLRESSVHEYFTYNKFRIHHTMLEQVDNVVGVE
ncbi:hypothetical protein HPP92_017476 [Vanilla planifolia]|uniref:Uncharacterized protein n=1 Tax=Vanilla planifolia TaxID=51239 RepID=A0A835QH52_VANPL|nr:hypothetical protein HPP92_017476 [Vanilla planifolia]